MFDFPSNIIIIIVVVVSQSSSLNSKYIKKTKE